MNGEGDTHPNVGTLESNYSFLLGLVVVEKSFTAGAKTLWDKIVMCHDQVVTYQIRRGGQHSRLSHRTCLIQN